MIDDITLTDEIQKRKMYGCRTMNNIQITDGAYKKLISLKGFYEYGGEEPITITFSQLIEFLYDDFCDAYGTPDVEVG